MSDQSGTTEMNPLLRVKPDHGGVGVGAVSLSAVPALAAKVAESIATCADIENGLGLILISLLGPSSRAPIKMYRSVGRTAQISMIRIVAEGAIPPDEYDVLTIVLNKVVSPALKQRDKFAHWIWARVGNLPNDLLLIDPDKFAEWDHGRMNGEVRPFPLEHAYVVTPKFVDQQISSMKLAHKYTGRLSAILWRRNTPEKRAELLAKLAGEPLIKAPLDDLHLKRRQNVPPAS